MDIIGEKPPDTTDSKSELYSEEVVITSDSTLQNSDVAESTNSKFEECKENTEIINKNPSEDDMEIDFECTKVELEENIENIQEKTDENNIENLIEDSQLSNGRMEETVTKKNDLNDVIEIESDQNDSNSKIDDDTELKLQLSSESVYEINNTNDQGNCMLNAENSMVNEENIEVASNTLNINENESEVITIEENDDAIVNIEENNINIANTEENNDNILNIEENNSNIVTIEENDHHFVNIEVNDTNIINIDENGRNIVHVETNDTNIINIEENDNNVVNVEEINSHIVNIEENNSNIVNIEENDSNMVNIQENDSNIVNIEGSDNNIVHIEDDPLSSDDAQIINNEDNIKSPESNVSPKREKPQSNSISAQQKIDSQILVDSIASEWNFSDGEGDPDSPPKSEISSTLPVNSNQKSSAEIIAMEWDDGSAPNENVNTENKIIEEVAEDNIEKKPDITEANNHANNDSSNSIICTVIENAEDNPEKNQNENIIILHDLSGLNLNNQNSGITIISVDENPDMNSPSNTSNENSYVIHELNIEPPPSNLTQLTNNDPNLNSTPSTPKTVEIRRSNRSKKYPYVVCSKEDLCKEIEQSRRVSTDVPPGGDVLFKNQIIKRLASKILPKSLNNTPPTIINNVDVKPVLDKPGTTTNSNSTVTTDQELLDILEGDSDIDVFNLQKAKENYLAGDDSKILKADEILSTPLATATSRSKPKKLDPDLEREIALQQLSEMPDIPTTKRKGKNNNVVVTNVPSTKIIEKTDHSTEGGDPFKFVENTKTVGTPSKYGVASVKTYSRKGGPAPEPSLKDIVIPKELEQYIDFNKQGSPKRRKYNRKSVTTNSPQVKSTSKRTKKVESDSVKTVEDKGSVEDNGGERENNEENDKEDKKTDNKIFLTDDTSNVLISKRSRIIKRKIIWDPSLKAPTYVLPSVAKGKIQKAKNTKHLIPKKKLKSIGNAIIKEDSVKDDSDKKENIKENNVISNDTNDKIEDKKESIEEKVNSSPNANITPNKRKVDSVTSSSSSGGASSQTRKKKFRYMSEIDKLLMDEGAVNMIYSVEQDEKTPLVRRQQRVISLDKFDKEIAKKKKMILTALNTSPESSSKALRKKDSNATPPVRKKSRDSIRSSIQSPPPSPNSMFPPRAEASRIIRRHSSSSSFSSECMSPRRLSAVDAPTVSSGNEKSKKTSTSEDGSKSTIIQQTKKDNSTTTMQPKKKMRIMKIVQPRNLRQRGGVPIFIKKNKTNSYTGTKSKYLIKRIENKIDGKKDESETKESEQKQEKTSTETENNVVLRSSATQQKASKKETPNKSSSPTPESYQNIVKSLDSNEISKKKEGTGGDGEKQRTSSRQNAGTYNYKEISVRKYDELVQIIFTPQSSTKMKNSLNIQTMREFCDALTSLKKDSSCKVLLITSTGSVFCRGLDYTPLIQQNIEKRKTIAQETANAVKEFVRAIVQFPRPVIAGVQGAASGLGVAILPLCDLVFVSDKATFSMNQCKLGCLPEGAASVSLPHVTSHAVAAELLIAGHTLTAMEALRHGLASRVLWPEGYFQELIPLCKAIASQSSQSMDTTKLLIRHSLSLKLEAALDSESHILVQHWVSSECQQLLKKFVEQQD